MLLSICSKQHVALLCSSHLAFSLCILLASMWCIHTVLLTQPQLGKPHFILSDISESHMITNQKQSTPPLVLCWHHFQLMRYCCCGMGTCFLILENYHTCTLVYLCSHWGQCLLLLTLGRRDSTQTGAFTTSARSSA